MSRRLRAPPKKKPRYTESSAESCSEDEYLPEGLHTKTTVFSSSRPASNSPLVEMSSTVLGLCLYHAMNMRIQSLQQFISKKNQDMNKICLFLSKYAAISVNFRKSVLNSISYWIRNNQSTLDLRAYIAKKGSLISRLNFNSAPATVSIQLTPKQLVMYLNGSRALKNLEKVLNPEFVVSLSLTGSSYPSLSSRLSSPFCFPNLQSLHICSGSIWQFIINTLDSYDLPNLRKLALSFSHNTRGRMCSELTLPASFSNLSELSVDICYSKFCLNVANLLNLVTFTFNSSYASSRFISHHELVGLSQLPMLRNFQTTCNVGDASNYHEAVSLHTFHHGYTEELFTLSTVSHLLEFKCFGLYSPRRYYHNQEPVPVNVLDFSKFLKLQRLYLTGIYHDLLDLERLTQLQELHLSICRFGAISFSPSSQLHTLTCRNLSSLTRETASCSIMGLEHLSNLKVLHFDSCHLSLNNVAVSMLSTLVEYRASHALINIAATNVLDNMRTLELTAVRYCSNLPNLPRLRALTLWSVGDRTIRLLTSTKVPLLESLTLVGGRVSESSFNALPSVRHLVINSVPGLAQFDFSR
ncbi:hypothetical protein RCL1_008747 [Eukaryota sp. TZLM3-RCL]